MKYEAHPLRLPASIRTAAERLAEEDGVTLNDWIASAVAQKIGAVETADYFRKRAGVERVEDLHEILARVPDRQPDPGDELPPGWEASQRA